MDEGCALLSVYACMCVWVAEVSAQDARYTHAVCLMQVCGELHDATTAAAVGPLNPRSGQM